MEITSEDKSVCVVVKQVWAESLSNSRNVWVKDFKHKENNENFSEQKFVFHLYTLMFLLSLCSRNSKRRLYIVKS